ncbi:MAG: ATP-binding protein [Prolixibacteraceae bacterium]|nr:ATP-binding protein [Prolixibacteraceae bacterium]
MPEHPTRKIVITGAESTGKSTLTAGLAQHYKALWIPEIARTYVEGLSRHYTYNDVEKIARLQVEAEQQLNADEPLVFFDTWLIITKVWFDFVYGKHPGWLHRCIVNSPIDLFLLCDIDLPWVEDPLRENGGENRVKLQQRYLQELHEYGFKYRLISGQHELRLQSAIQEVEILLRG